MRLFVALPLSSSVGDEIAGISERFTFIGDGLRWTARAAWHITLQFLGNSNPDRLVDLLANLRKVQSPPVPIKLGALGFFDSAGVLFVEVDLSPELLGLQQEVVQATSQCGFRPEDRPYHPHITLARAKGKLHKEQGRALDAKMPDGIRFSRFVVSEFLLYESFLGSEGSRHEVRKRFRLTAVEQ
jgi:2'-5' RNA ligase